MDKDPQKIANELKTDLAEYFSLKGRVLKLTTYEKSAKITATLSLGLTILILSLFAILFIFTTLALVIGEYLNNIAYGFAILSLFYLVSLAILFFFREKWQTIIIEKILTVLTDNDTNNDPSTPIE